jgi:hypothetical protein
MAIPFQREGGLEAPLRRDPGGLGRAARDALLIGA